MVKIKNVAGAWPTKAAAEEFIASVAARGQDAWAACVGIPAAQVEFIEEEATAPSIEVQTAFTKAVAAHDKWAYIGGADMELVHVSASPAFWTAKAFDSFGNLLATAKGNTEAEAKEAALMAAESAE